MTEKREGEFSASAPKKFGKSKSSPPGKSDLPKVARKMSRGVYPGKFRRGVKCASHPGKSGPGAARAPAAPDRRPGTTGPAPERCRPAPPPRSAAAGRDRLTVAAARLEGPPPAHAGQAERNRTTPGPAPRLHTLNYSPGPGPAHRRLEPSPPAGDRAGPGEIGPRTGPRQNAQKDCYIFVQYSILKYSLLYAKIQTVREQQKQAAPDRGRAIKKPLLGQIWRLKKLCIIKSTAKLKSWR